VLIFPKCILMDFDGTLVDSLKILQKAYFNFSIEYGLKSSIEEFSDLNGPPIKAIVQILKAKHGIQASVEELELKYLEIIKSLYDDVKINKGGAELIKLVKEKNSKVGIVTSNYRQVVNDWLQFNKLANLIDFTVCSEDVEVGKPNPEPYLRAIEISGVDRSTIIAIEDSVSGLESAIQARLTVFHYSVTDEPHNKHEVEIVASLFDMVKKLTRI
jgi:beta-phosphoglucomutase